MLSEYLKNPQRFRFWKRPSAVVSCKNWLELPFDHLPGAVAHDLLFARELKIHP
jgi:hypothetical protein